MMAFLKKKTEVNLPALSGFQNPVIWFKKKNKTNTDTNN